MSISLVSDGMLPKSVDGLLANTEPSRSANAPGVCREQTAAAKAKVCSIPVRNGRGCNTKYIHFYVDPLMLFRWSESRTWPNQLVDIRILSLRLALVYKARMFATVLDGWTA